MNKIRSRSAIEQKAREDHRFLLQIAKFRAVAKLTHNQYGTISQPAAEEIRQKNMSVVRMAAHKGRTSSKPASGLFSPKKRGDYAALKMS
jgi:hypothetical protein